MPLCQHFSTLALTRRRLSFACVCAITSLTFLVRVISLQAQVIENRIIESLQIVGTQRPVHLETQVGEVLDRGGISREVHRLWSSGWFDDIRVETTEEGGRVGVVFHVVERPRYFLRRIEFKPSEGQRPVTIKPGTLVDRYVAHQVSVELRNQLVEEGHRDAEVQEVLVPVDYRQVDLRLCVKPGPRYRINEIRFVGPSIFDRERLAQTLHSTRTRRILPAVPGLWKGWQLRPPFSFRRLDADLEALRSFYFSQGYWDAAVILAGVEFSGNEAYVSIALEAGRHFNVSRTHLVEGTTGRESFTSLRDSLPEGGLCRCLRQAQRKAEKEGRVDFSVRAEVQTSPEPAAVKPASKVDPGNGGAENHWVALSARVEAGPSYRVGRIEFRGNHNFSDSTLRRMLLLNEGDLFDSGQLRRSLSRLNSVGFFKPIRADHVLIERDPMAYQLDLTLDLEEMPRGGWAFSGSLEPFSMPRPLQLSVGSRLPAWGGSALELSTYFATLSLFPFPPLIPQGLALGGGTRWMPRFAVGRPYLPGQGWRSGFVLSPQLGWQKSLASSGLIRARGVVSILKENPAEPPKLAVPIWHGGKEGDDGARLRFAGSLLCEVAKPRLAWARSAGLTALGLLLSLPMI